MPKPTGLTWLAPICVFAQAFGVFAGDGACSEEGALPGASHGPHEGMPMWDLSCMVWRIGKILDFEAQVRWIAEAGFEAISFHASPGKAGVWVGLEPAHLDTEERARVRELLSRFSVCEIHAPFDCELAAETPAPVLEKLEEVVQFAADVGADVVTVHADAPDAAKDAAPQSWNNALDRLNDFAGRAGVRIGIEFMTGFEWLVRPRREWIGATLDVGHMYLRDGAGYRPYGTIGDLVRFLGDSLLHVHVHDYDGNVDHIEVGTGRVDFDGFLRGLADIGYGGALCLEANPDRVTPDGIRRSADYLRQRARGLGLR